jgi:protein ATS1
MSETCLYAFGSNGSGQLGIGHAEDVSEPTKVLLGPHAKSKSIVDIASGGNHSVILFDDATIITHGDNDDGRCVNHHGSGSETLRDGIKHAENSLYSSGISHIAATWSATIMVYESMNVRVVGSGESGQLGLGPGVTTCAKPTLVKDFPPSGLRIVKMAACMAHVAVVLSNGEVWGWGSGRKGQLGRPAEIIWAPRKIEQIDFLAADVACGKDFTCVFGDSQVGRLALFGLDRNDRFDVRADTPGQLPPWKQVASSWGSLFVQTNDGKIIAWGRNDHAQLPPHGLLPLKTFAAGSEHCIGLTKSGSVVAWGWGEHGNCGPITEHSDDALRHRPEIKIADEVVALFGGCATSFIVTKT